MYIIIDIYRRANIDDIVVAKRSVCIAINAFALFPCQWAKSAKQKKNNKPVFVLSLNYFCRLFIKPRHIKLL